LARLHRYAKRRAQKCGELDAAFALSVGISQTTQKSLDNFNAL
jgi:hypothetical protein